MGTIQHDVLICTTWSDEEAEAFAGWLEEKTGHTGSLVALESGAGLPWTKSYATCNGYHTFFIGPDGSKEGWDRSNQGNALREDAIGWLDDRRFDDRSSPWELVEVSYGEQGQSIGAVT